jgi:hypothetical protein
MTMESLAFIASALSKAGVRYAYQRWNESDGDLYWIGSYSEQQYLPEDQSQTTLFILDGFSTSGSWSRLEAEKETIKASFADVRELLTSESGISVRVESVQTIPTGTADVKRIEIQLLVKEWRV